MAALAMQRAAELAPSCAEFADDLARLLRRIPHQHADLLQVLFLRAHALVERCRRLPHECCTWRATQTRTHDRSGAASLPTLLRSADQAPGSATRPNMLWQYVCVSGPAL